MFPGGYWYHIQDFKEILIRIFIISRCPSFPKLTTLFDFQNVEIWKTRCPEDIPIISCIFAITLHNKSEKVDLWSMFGHLLESSQHNSKSIGICQEALIGHFGIIKTHKTPQKTVNKRRRTNKSPNLFCHIFPLYIPFLGC